MSKREFLKTKEDKEAVLETKAEETKIEKEPALVKSEAENKDKK